MVVPHAALRTAKYMNIRIAIDYGVTTVYPFPADCGPAANDPRSARKVGRYLQEIARLGDLH